MTHYVFSNSLTFDNPDPKVLVRPIRIEEIDKIKKQNGTDIYLCGGGNFAGWLLNNNQIDILKIKLNPLLLGKGVRILGDAGSDFKLELIETDRYDNGLQIMTYKLR
jgi:dihydrofolate reductase